MPKDDPIRAKMFEKIPTGAIAGTLKETWHSKDFREEIEAQVSCWLMVEELASRIPGLDEALTVVAIQQPTIGRFRAVVFEYVSKFVV
jgi:hypothetical protein